MTQELKRLVFGALRHQIEQRMATIKQSMDDAHTAGLEETKSSSGDKYETGRAMMHLEMEKFSSQLAEVEKQLAVLQKIKLIPHDRAGMGSLIETNLGNYFLAVSGGLIKLPGADVMAVSTASPIGSLLQGKQGGDTFIFNTKSVTIQRVI